VVFFWITDKFQNDSGVYASFFHINYPRIQSAEGIFIILASSRLSNFTLALGIWRVFRIPELF
jgi:hypothetical protein